jgi:hypothetical protein
MRIILTALCACVACTGAMAAGLTPDQLDRIGARIWQNEGAGRIENLTAWNTGENFPSLGIGHFIWYPAGARGPFDESFPKLVHFAIARGATPPEWLARDPGQPCPWPTRAAFLRERDGARLSALRQWLARTRGVQAEFCAARLDSALPLMRDGLPAADAQRLASRFRALAQSERGLFAMIDYVNFKGEGVKATERYNGQGWGLRQVLLDMRSDDVKAFGEAAARVLRRRIANSPPDRGESRWEAGWMNRVAAY